MTTTHHDVAHGPAECTTEASQLGRLVALASPFFAILTGWVAAWVAAHVPGVDLDQGQITAFMVSATTAALSSSWKWLQGWQQHELLVARGEVAPRRHVHGTRCAEKSREVTVHERPGDDRLRKLSTSGAISS